MACTKIFSGDLPEITSEIIQYFRDDFSTLHSCILVNRLWCRLAIPLLWEDPFSLRYPKNYRYIEVYLHNLNDDDKTQLDEYGITSNDLFSSNILFNYPSFIKYLDTRKISDSIEKWVTTIRTATIIYSVQINYKKLIYRLLFRIFIEKEVNIHTFKVTVLTDEDCEHFNGTIELILQNPNFICNIRNLTLDFDPTNENITKFMIFLYSNCNSISSLGFLFPWYYYPITEKHLSQIIESQQNLKKIFLCYNNLPLYHSLLSFKGPNCTNTLRTIICYHVNFKNIVTLNEVLEQLNVLESIHILYCYSLDSNFIQQIVNLTKTFKLKSLFMNETLIEPLKLLLQKSGDYLENFGLELEYELLKQEVLELIIKYCSTKIKFLKFYEFDNQNIYKIFKLIEKVEPSLNYLTIESYDCDVELCSIVLRNLGQILPSRLEYLSLVLTINTRDFEIFLKDLQNTFIKKLLIKNLRNGKREELERKNILPYIKEYIMKKKKTKQLAYIDYFCVQTLVEDDDLFSLKNEVKEFRLHNIVVQNYYDLNIEIREYINEMY
jgi:hypothetical protein